MMKSVLKLLLALLLTLPTLAGSAQIKKMGNKPRSGSSTTTFAVVKGSEMAVIMDAGSKPVQLLSLNFGVEHLRTDSLPYKVNVSDLKDTTTNYITSAIIGMIVPGKQRVVIDLSSHNIIVKGKVMVGIEWLKTQPGQSPFFAIGLFNGGTYHRAGAGKPWQKTPVAGVDFNATIKKL